jgi:7,8-dihydro-6-hydroxymethylpterin-pyrophosphokinase
VNRVISNMRERARQFRMLAAVTYDPRVALQLEQWARDVDIDIVQLQSKISNRDLSIPACTSDSEERDYICELLASLDAKLQVLAGDNDKESAVTALRAILDELAAIVLPEAELTV